MAANDRVLDTYLAHRTMLLRVEQGIVRDVLRILERGEAQAVGRLASAYAELLESLRGRSASPFTGDGLDFVRLMRKRNQEALAEVFPVARKEIRRHLAAIGLEELEVFADSLEAVLPKVALADVGFSRVPVRQLEELARNRVALRREGSARQILDDFSAIENNALVRVNRVIEDGVRDGTGMRDMVRRARRAVGVTSGATRAEVESYVRTVVQGVANDTAAILYQENADILEGEQYFATLDDSTCPICGPLDGQVFPFVSGRSTIPRPPRHPNCRCFVAPWVKSWEDMGLDGLSPRARAALDGKPAERVQWREWVTRKPARMRAVFGPTRAQALREGRVSVDDLSTTKEVLTLEELGLKRREAA